MRTVRDAFTAFFIFVFCAHAGASVIDGPFTNPFNGDAYYLLSADTWTNSQAEAVAMGGTLATINNLAENTWVFDTFAPLRPDPGSNLWIGFYDPTLNDGTGAQHAADFIWASGAPGVYTNWSPGQPDNSPAFGGEYYGIIQSYSYPGLVTGDWNDNSNTASGGSLDNGVVQVVPEPAGLSILGLAGLCMIIRRRNYR